MAVGRAAALRPGGPLARRFLAVRLIRSPPASRPRLPPGPYLPSMVRPGPNRLPSAVRVRGASARAFEQQGSGPGRAQGQPVGLVVGRTAFVHGGARASL